jgi:hypothetical protein
MHEILAKPAREITVAEWTALLEIVEQAPDLPIVEQAPDLPDEQPDPAYEITPTGLVENRTLTVEEWSALGNGLLLTKAALPWVLGDWLLLGERYGDKHADAIQLTGRDYDTIQRYKHVARKIPPRVRRDPRQIAWTYHKALTSLRPQVQNFYLSLIERQRAGAPLPETAAPLPLLDTSTTFHRFVLTNEAAKHAARTIGSAPVAELRQSDKAQAARAAIGMAEPATESSPSPNVPNRDIPTAPDIPNGDIATAAPTAELLPPCPICGGTFGEIKCRDCGAAAMDLLWLLHDLIKDLQSFYDTGELGAHMESYKPQERT